MKLSFSSVEGLFQSLQTYSGGVIDPIRNFVESYHIVSSM